MQIFGMQLIHHLFGLRIILFVELHCAPAVFAPVLPILNQGIDGDLSLPKFGSDIENFLLAVISLSTLQVTIGPLWKQWRLARELTVISNYAVQLRAVEEVVINCLPHLRTERRSVMGRLDCQLNASRPTFCGDLILPARLQLHRT